MESRKSIIHKRIESVVQSSPSESSPSPLRRKSIIAQNPSLNILENDDEAERIARRREMCSTSTPSISINNHSIKRHSLGLGFLANIPAPQMAESINECIKLSTENKISIKNAFSLEMIDFMTYMIKKQDANMSNLQVASTSLDVSTKIYGFRVDSVHTEILKIVGGLDHQIADEQNSKEQENILEEGMEANVDVQKKKKKKNKQKIISTAEALRVNIDIVKPMCMQIGEEDLQTTDMLYQAMLPNHASSGFYQHLYNDVLVDIEDNAESRSNSSTKYITPIIDDSSNSEICMSYSNFEFLGWSVEDEPEEMSDKEAELSIDDGNRFQFDLNASVTEEEEEHNGTNNIEPMNYFDIEHEDGNINSDVGCHQQAMGPNRRNDNIVDVQASATLASEYSFVQPSVSLHWAGPSHWKFRNFAKHLNATTTTDSKVMEACMQAPIRQRKQIILSYDEINDDVIKAKFTQSQLNRLQAKTVKSEWSTESVTLPEDVHYDVTQMTKQYLYQSLTVADNSKKRDDVVTVANVSDNERYDYNNPNDDTSEYCLDVNNDYDDRDKDDCNFEDAAALATQGFTGENLVAAPKLANKMSIAYCVKAKKIDMRQLKETMWKSLKSTNEKLTKETAEGMSTMSKKFSSIYKMLPNLLSKTNVEALSAPVAFFSLLHLTNENNLQISSQSDLSDIVIEDS